MSSTIAGSTGITREAGTSGASVVRPSVTRSRTWAFAGLGAGVCGLAGIVLSGSLNAVYDPAYAGDPDKIVARLGEQTVQLIAFHTAFTGLHRAAGDLRRPAGRSRGE